MAFVDNNQGTATDPVTMHLFPTELARAQLIKRAVDANDEVGNLTDFEYVQFALGWEDDPIDVIVQKIAMYHSFRQEYGVKETVNDGVTSFSDMTIEFYGAVLSLQYLAPKRSYVVVMDWGSSIPPTTEEGHRKYFRGLYYMFHSLLPNFEAMRSGTTMVIECEGAGRKNISVDHLQKLASHLYSHYPKKQKESYFLNSPSLVNVACTLFFKMTNQNVRDSIKLGFQIEGWEGRRIDGLYKNPTPEAARIQMLESCRTFLELRYRNMECFKLP